MSFTPASSSRETKTSNECYCLWRSTVHKNSFDNTFVDHVFFWMASLLRYDTYGNFESFRRTRLECWNYPGRMEARFVFFGGTVTDSSWMYVFQVLEECSFFRWSQMLASEKEIMHTLSKQPHHLDPYKQKGQGILAWRLSQNWLHGFHWLEGNNPWGFTS